MKKIVLFSNDPGGAQVLSSYFYYSKKKNIFLCSSISTESFFKEKNIKYKKISFKDAIKFGDLFYTSTSWRSDLEIKAIKILSKDSRKIISLLDGWENYKNRFYYKKNYYFPNEIWTFDKTGYKNCQKIFPATLRIKLKDNYFLKYAKEQILKYKKKKIYRKKCVFFTEPLTATYQKLYKKNPPYSELKAFEFFLRNVKKIKDIKFISVKIHPNDTKSSYLKIIKKFKDLKIRITNDNIFKILAENYYLASCSSSVMFLGDKNKNCLICTIPKKNISSNLPINRMKFLINL